MLRFVAVLSALTLANAAGAIPPNLNSRTGVLGIVSGASGIYMLCADGNIYLGANPGMHDGVETPGSWGAALGHVPAAVEDIVEFWGPGFQTREGTIWVWASAYETFWWIGPGEDTVSGRREIGQYWAAYPASPCSPPPVSIGDRSLGGLKALFR